MVAIVTDSAANLPGEVARDLGIQVASMYLKLGEEVYRDGVDLTPSDFYERLAERREAASSSTPSPADFLAAYERTGAAEIVCVTVAAGMSAANHEAAMAAQRFDGRVEVVDSKSAAMAEGFVALEAARLAATGAAIEDVTARAREVADRTTLYATVDTFEFLRRSGRVTKVQAYAATMLDIKPVFRFRGGDVSPVARPRTRRRAIDRIATDTLRDVGGRPVHLATMHAAAARDAEALRERIAAEADVVEAFVTEVTPVIGAHTGPGLVGVAFHCQ